MYSCKVSLTICVTWATSQPAASAERCERIRSVWSASAPPTRYKNWAYAVRSTSPRVIRPPDRKGLANAVVDDVAMIVLSRSKKAAACVPGRAGASAVSYTHLRAHETRHDLV